MMPAEAFWDMICCRPGLTAAAMEWRQGLGDAVWETLRGSLFRADGVASAVRVGDRSYTVIPMKTAEYGLVCDVTGEVQAHRPTKLDVRCFQLNLSAWRNAVAAALQLRAEPLPAQDTARACSLGLWTPVVGSTLPAFMVIPPTRAVLVAEVRRLLAETPGGFLLVTPRPMNLETAIHDHLERKQAIVAALSEILTLDHTGAFKPTPLWEQHRASYCRRFLSDRMVAPLPAFLFTKKAMWSIRFRGKETNLEGTLKGPVFIRYLLQRPGQETHVARMLADIAGDERIDHASNSGDITNKQTLDEAKRRYHELLEEKSDAERNNDAARLDRANEEIGQITSYFSECVGLGGKSRKAHDDINKIRKRITRVMETAYDKIADNDSALGAHLRKCVTTGTFMKYEPETPIDWNFA